MADYSVEVDHAGAMSVTAGLLGLDGMDTTVHVPETVRTEATVHVPETVRTDATVHVPGTVRTDATVHVPEPVNVASTVDVRPLAVDQCLRIQLAPLPPTRVRTPWEQRFALRVLGVEWFSATISGESSTYVEPAPRHPVVAPADTPGPSAAAPGDRGIVLRLGGP